MHLRFHWASCFQRRNTLQRRLSQKSTNIAKSEKESSRNTSTCPEGMRTMQKLQFRLHRRHIEFGNAKTMYTFTCNDATSILPFSATSSHGANALFTPCPLNSPILLHPSPLISFHFFLDLLLLVRIGLTNMTKAAMHALRAFSRAVELARPATSTMMQSRSNAGETPNTERERIQAGRVDMAVYVLFLTQTWCF